MGKEPRPVGELMSIVRKVEWWPPRLATYLVLHNEHDNDDSGDDHDGRYDIGRPSRIAFSGMLFINYSSPTDRPPMFKVSNWILNGPFMIASFSSTQMIRINKEIMQPSVINNIDTISISFSRCTAHKRFVGFIVRHLSCKFPSFLLN